MSLPKMLFRVLALAVENPRTAWIDVRLRRRDDAMTGEVVALDDAAVITVAFETGQNDTLNRCSLTVGAMRGEVVVTSNKLIGYTSVNADGVVQPESFSVKFSDGSELALPLTRRAGHDLLDSLLGRHD